MVPPPYPGANPFPFKGIRDCIPTLQDSRNGALPWSLQAGPRDPSLDPERKDPP